jgi:hypothetical protein
VECPARKQFEGAYVARSHENDCYHAVGFVLCERGVCPAELQAAGRRQDTARRSAVEFRKEMLRQSGGRAKAARRSASQLHEEVRVGRNRQLIRFDIRLRYLRKVSAAVIASGIRAK